MLPLCLLSACSDTPHVRLQRMSQADLLDVAAADTLRVATMYGSVSYFYYQDQPMGYDYELCRNLADSLHVALQVKMASTTEQMRQMLRTGEVDVAAYNFTTSRATQSDFYITPTHGQSDMVLVQRIGKTAINNVTELEGCRVTVVRNSAFHHRLQTLNAETGGGIRIVLAPDSLTTDGLLKQVAAGDIDYTLAYRNRFDLFQRYYRNLDGRVAVSFVRPMGWMTRRNSTQLNKMLDEWWRHFDEKQKQRLLAKYWQHNQLLSSEKPLHIPQGAVSPYDAYFRKYAPEIDWDWRLLAALCYHESRFDTTVVSYMGARGLMQLMPGTADRFGLSAQNAHDPEASIAAGVQYIKYLKMVYRRVPDAAECTKFVLASYNAGPAHVLDAMQLAKKYGKNPNVWFGNVDVYLQKKSDPEYYNDPVCKYGYFRGKQTVKYVQNVMDTYHKYLGHD